MRQLCLIIIMLAGVLGVAGKQAAAEGQRQMTVALEDRQTARPPASDAEALQAVRSEIDAIDAAILELLAQRYTAVEEVRRVKGVETSGKSPLRPSREAEVIRRLLSLRKDPLPPEIVVAIWREVMGSATQRQQVTPVHVPAAGNGDHTFRDTVKAYFGSQAPIVEHENAARAVAELRAHGQHLAAVPIHAPGWAADLLQAEGDLEVIARLPFLGGSQQSDGFVIGNTPGAPTGDDETLVAIVTPAPDEPAFDRKLVREFWRDRSTETQGGYLWLGVLKGWHDSDAAREAFGAETKSGLAVTILGRYATPVR